MLKFATAAATVALSLTLVSAPAHAAPAQAAPAVIGFGECWTRSYYDMRWNVSLNFLQWWNPTCWYAWATGAGRP